jgi:hypothetical protein
MSPMSLRASTVAAARPSAEERSWPSVARLAKKLLSGEAAFT